MQIKPFKDDEINNSVRTSSFGPGAYEFTVDNFFQKISQNNVDMLELHVKLHDGDNESKFSVRTTLYFSEAARWRVVLFFKCVNALEMIKKDELDLEKLKGLRGKGTFVEEINANTNKAYLKLDEFLPHEESGDPEKIHADKKDGSDFEDDDLPF